MDIRDRSTRLIPASALADAELDISGEVCPMTFVKTRLALEQLAPGQTLLVRLADAEARANVPRAARAQGHEVLAEETDALGITRVLIRRRT